MKTALMSLVVLASLNAFGATEYSISAPSVVPSQYGVSASDVQYCPTPETAVVVQGQDLKGLSLALAGGNTVLIETTPSGSYRGCMSDILCPTDDTFDFAGGYASITRNNDGNYPTTDLPGYSALSISLTTAPTQKGRVDCYYSLTPAN